MAKADEGNNMEICLMVKNPVKWKYYGYLASVTMPMPETISIETVMRPAVVERTRGPGSWLRTRHDALR
jgi:hypothetical protein